MLNNLMVEMRCRTPICFRFSCQFCCFGVHTLGSAVGSVVFGVHRLDSAVGSVVLVSIL